MSTNTIEKVSGNCKIKVRAFKTYVFVYSSVGTYVRALINKLNSELVKYSVN